MRFIWILSFFLVSVNFTAAQIVTVVDAETNNPLEDVILYNKNPLVSVSTNAQGQANVIAFKDLSTIEILNYGYKTKNVSYDQIEASNFKVALQTANLSLDQVVVSGTRWKQSLGSLPNKVSLISEQDIAFNNPQTAADLLGISGEVFIQKSQQGGGSPMIRGFATNRLVYTVDGIRMNTAIFRGGNLQNVINLDPFSTKSTEVLFGPGSVIYGSDAIGGVMSFKTLSPQFSLTNEPSITGKVVARYSSANNEKTGHFDVNVGWDKWAFLTSISSWDFNHLKQGSHGPKEYIKPTYVQRQNNEDVIITQDDPLLQIPSAYSQINLMQKVAFKPNEKWDFNYGFHFSETSPYGRYDRHNRERNGTARYAEWNYGPQLWLMNNLTVNHSERTGVYDQFSLKLAQQSFEESRIDRSLNDSERSTKTEHVNAYSINLDFTKNFKSRNTLFYGIEYVLNKVKSKGENTNITSEIQEIASSRYPNATWKSLGAYVTNEYKVSDAFTLQGGIRYNHFIIDADFSNNLSFYPLPQQKANIDNGALTVSLGWVYKTDHDWIVRMNLGTAFRSPNVDDIGKVFDSEPGSVVVPNPDLKAEYAYNLDLGFTKVFNDIVRFDITGFYTLLNNAMVRRDFELNGENTIEYDGEMSNVQAIQNAASAKVYGVHAGVEVKLPSYFSFLSDVNFQKGEEELDDDVISASRHAAPIFGVSRLRYKYKNIFLECNTVYQGKKSFKHLAIEEQGKDEIYAKDSNGNNYAPSWYTLNFKWQYKLSKKLAIGGGVENITDQRYRPYSSGISGAGRSFVFSFTGEF